MAIVINGNGIDMGNNPVSNASQIDGVVINENGSNVRTENDSYSKTEVDGKIVGFKNYIINGNFDVWQRGTSQTTSGYGSDDRWTNRNIGSTKTNSQVACTDTERSLFNAPAFSRIVVSSVAGAGNVVDKYQKIEDVTKLAGKTVTLSFWAKADTSKNIAIEFWQSFGSGGSPSAVVLSICSQLVALTSTWQKKTITVSLPSIIGKTLGTYGVNTSYTAVNFYFDAGSSFDARTANLGQQSGTFDIAQVQLEEGSIATPFEQRPIGLELSLCQRYYEFGHEERSGCKVTGNNNVWDGYAHTESIRFKTIKRVAPTVATFNMYGLLSNNTGSLIQSLGSYGGPSTQTATIYGCGLAGNWAWYNNAGSNITNIVACSFDWTASAEL